MPRLQALSRNPFRPAGAALLSVTLSVSAGAGAGFKDPAPPRPQAVVENPAAAPKVQPGLTFHKAPKPLAPGAVVGDWRSYLGPTLNAVSPEKPLLRRFPKDGLKPVWEVARGEGYAAPTVVGERVLMFHRQGGEDALECLQAETGRRFWRTAYRSNYQDRYGFNGGPRCQPISDGKRVVSLGAGGILQCVDLISGAMIWRRDLLAEFKIKQNFFGVGATPLLEGGRVIVLLGAPGGPSVGAFDLATGKLAWGSGKEWTAGYAAPIAATVQGKRRIYVFQGGDSRPTSGGVMGIDAATGALEWSMPWRARVYESVNGSAPLVIGNRVFISECYGPGGVMVEIAPNGSGKKLWETEALRTHFMTAVYEDGHLYGVDGHGPQDAPLVCIDAATGKEKWRHEPAWEDLIPLPTGPRKVPLNAGLATLIRADGRCLMLTQYGHLVWLELNPKGYKELDRTHLFFGTETWSPPAISRGLLFVSQNDGGADGSTHRLLCYDLRGN